MKRGGNVAIKAGTYRLGNMPTADAPIASMAKMLSAKLVADDRHFADLDIDLLKLR